MHSPNVVSAADLAAFMTRLFPFARQRPDCMSTSPARILRGGNGVFHPTALHVLAPTDPREIEANRVATQAQLDAEKNTADAVAEKTRVDPEQRSVLKKIR